MAKKRNKKGLPPGSIVFMGDKKVEKIFLHHLQYNDQHLEEKTFDNHKKIIYSHSSDNILDWYDIRGLHDIKLIESLGHTFNIHPLVLEDIANTHQRPKFEEYEKGNFVIIRALAFDKDKLQVNTEQIALYFGKELLVSFQETESDLFETVRNRIKKSSGKIRQRGADYLCYALLDTIVDHYFIVLDEIEEIIEALENKLLGQPDSSIKKDIHHLKKQLLVVRKSIAPLREAIGRFSKSESPLIEEGSAFFLRDLYDHTIQVMDMTESYRDMLNGLQDLYLSEISFKMNQVMQVLTLIATIFIPLTFLVGVYGMNFDNMPELHWHYGYYVLWGIMIAIFIALILVFKKKRWM